MKNMFHNILITSIVLSLTCAPVMVNAMPEPAPAAMTEKEKAAAAKAKEAEKKKREAEKAKAAKEKEKAKAAAEKQKEKDKAAAEKAKQKAAADKEKAKQQAQREKDAQEREEARLKKEEETRAKEAKAIKDYQEYQENLENPKPEVISFVGIGLRAGYSALMDKIQPAADGSYYGAGTLNTSNALQQLKGGGGIGLDVTYNMQYDHLLFETGLDFRFLNSTSAYGFTAERIDKTYGSKYFYFFDNLSETRNITQLGIPVMLGAQFGRYYFLAGAKVHLFMSGNYSHKGQYDIVVDDDALAAPYGMGIHDVPAKTDKPIQFMNPDLSLAAEVGIDLDEWLQLSPDTKKKKQQIKPGQRLPFGREHIHYRAGLFAECSVLNTNSTPNSAPLNFAADAVKPSATNTLLAMNGNTTLHNLFIGAKFLVQFEIPGKKARPVPPPPAYAMYSIVDAETNQPLRVALVETHDNASGKITLREKQITQKGYRQKCALGTYTAEAKAEGYYNASQSFTIEEVGTTEYVTIAMRPRPVLRVRVTNKETGLVVPANVQVRKRSSNELAYTLATDSASGSASHMLEDGDYTLHIAQIGYDTLDMVLASIGDSLNIQLTPVKKGEVFVVKNLFFATNKTRILPTSEGALQDLYMYLARNPQVRIRIIGHTDNVGKDEANQKLSEGRAEAVKKDLIERGLTPDRLESEGRGESQPIDTNDTEEGRQNNRRVEIEIL